MAIPARVIRDLPKLTWRGLFAPCEAAPVDFSHAQAVREQYQIDDAWHDHGGLKPLDIKVKLHFLNTMFDGVVWFPNEYNKWQAALFDGSPGKLRHPILGEIDAVVMSGSIALEARQSGGVSSVSRWPLWSRGRSDQPEPSQTGQRCSAFTTSRHSASLKGSGWGRSTLTER